MIPTNETLKASPCVSVPKVLADDGDLVLSTVSVSEIGSLGSTNVNTLGQSIG